MKIGNMNITNEDCMDLMARYPDKYFDLAIVDPPYGIERFKKGGSHVNKYGSIKGAWNNVKPQTEYFTKLFNISKKQIIWGGNYFTLPLTGGWIYWNKMRGKNFSFADGELAWTNFLNNIKQANIKYNGVFGADTYRIHPTQKPVALYKWLLHNYAKPGDKILDTHLGSGSIAIACHDYNFELTACELDAEYYEAAVNRIKNHVNQLKMF